jgi:RNA polymerase sigma-70 factor (ECF subfamily)
MPETLASAEPSPASTAERQEQSENLWARARRLLGRREFEVMWLRFGEELSTEETARITGLTATHVKVIVHRARQQLSNGRTKA